MPRGGWCRRRVVPVNGVSEIHSWPLWGDPVVNVLHAAVQVAVPPHIHDCKDLQLKVRNPLKYIISSFVNKVATILTFSQ